MSIRKARIAEVVRRFEGGRYDPHYLAYFECFNDGLFYEAHEVLENLWLGARKEKRGNFYKGLIQLAGAFVHLQKNRVKPATALLKLASENLHKYGEHYEGLNLKDVQEVIGQWVGAMESGGYEVNPSFAEGAGRPKLAVPVGGSAGIEQQS